MHGLFSSKAEFSMTGSEDQRPTPASVADLPNLAKALDDDRFRQFLDHVPFAVAVSELGQGERLVYGNIEFERLTGLHAEDLQGQQWNVLPSSPSVDGGGELAVALLENEEYLGVFSVRAPDAVRSVDAWSNTIVDDVGAPLFRLLALSERDRSDVEAALTQSLVEKDVLLKELQHRVKNNLQMITALIRMEARNAQRQEESERFGHLAGRIEALSILYRSLYGSNETETVDLGIYVSQIATSVMAVHAVEGIRLDMKVDTWLVSVNVAMPVGLVVNELMTNALKYAFAGRNGGEIKVRCTVDNDGCKILVSDDGVGLSNNADWPRRGKLSAMIVQSVKQNAHADIDVVSEPGSGVAVTITFKRENATAKED